MFEACGKHARQHKRARIPHGAASILSKHKPPCEQFSEPLLSCSAPSCGFPSPVVRARVKTKHLSWNLVRHFVKCTCVSFVSHMYRVSLFFH